MKRLEKYMSAVQFEMVASRSKMVMKGFGKWLVSMSPVDILFMAHLYACVISNDCYTW